ncbi:hypothetical protein F5Y02DRAFT_413329 [Annulohypoxylon stygium]|nr:hypothetical protein F5Y02DRAFT_413329 [Annulohypoxylon stygium]
MKLPLGLVMLGLPHVFGFDRPRTRYISNTCKVTPDDAAWPSDSDWTNLNTSIAGALIKTRPAASSCYDGNPFGSSLSCAYVEDNWGYSAFHSSLPESVDYPLFTNNSCLPPTADGYLQAKGCEIGGLPQFVVNATTEGQIATALKWAAERNIRVVVKGTGHELSGRSTGAFSLSIWTRHLLNLAYDPEWRIPGSNSTANVLIAGSGNNWGSALPYALSYGRVVVSGVDATVGLGGYIQGGGHGPLSSTYGLSADQILQVTIVTTRGEVLTANAIENQDLYWAIRGGGGGQYGVVTEYVMLTFPEPTNIITSSLTINQKNLNDTNPATINATWDAVALTLAKLPDLMDAGVVGSGLAAVGTSGKSVLGLPSTPTGAALSLSFWAYNSTVDDLASKLKSLQEQLLNVSTAASTALNVVVAEPSITPNFSAFFDSMNAAGSAAGTGGVSSSRLLGRAELSDRPLQEVRSYLQRVMAYQSPGTGAILVIGMQGGPGPRQVPSDRRGAVNPVWRKAYLHVLASGGYTDSSGAVTPYQALLNAADWTEVNQEAVWREWAPETGAYMNEANPFDGQWQHDFYGTSYDKLLQVKRKYDPSESLYVLSGVGTEDWEYNMDTGKLCRKIVGS